MKKRISWLLTGTMLLSLLLSACGAPSAAEPTPDAAESPAASAPAGTKTDAAVTSAVPESTEPVQTQKPTPETTAEPSQAAESEPLPVAAASAPPQGGNVQTPQPTRAPAVISTPAPATPAPATPSPAPDVPPASVSTQPEPTPEPAPEPTPEPAPAPAATKEVAMTFIGRSVSSLIAAIGQPIGSDYAPSCLGSGEDGELFYNGFTVYTYREGSTETVQDVI